PGEHQPIIDVKTWDRVQAILARNGVTGSVARNTSNALLKGILRCKPCDCAMTPTFSCKAGRKKYRYYLCSSAQKRGWGACPSKSVPAGQIEQFVVERLQNVGTDPKLLQAALAEAREQTEERLKELKTERSGLERERGRSHGELKKLVAQGTLMNGSAAHLADLQDRLTHLEQRL